MRGHTTWKTGAREYQDMWRMRGHKTMKRNRAEAVATARVLGTAVEWEGVWYGTHWKTQKHHIRQLVPPHCHITYTKWEGVWYTFKHTKYDSCLLLTVIFTYTKGHDAMQREGVQAALININFTASYSSLLLDSSQSPSQDSSQKWTGAAPGTLEGAGALDCWICWGWAPAASKIFPDTSKYKSCEHIEITALHWWVVVWWLWTEFRSCCAWGFRLIQARWRSGGRECCHTQNMRAH